MAVLSMLHDYFTRLDSMVDAVPGAYKVTASEKLAAGLDRFPQASTCAATPVSQACTGLVTSIQEASTDRMRASAISSRHSFTSPPSLPPPQYETVGDAYVVAVNLLSPCKNHQLVALRIALSMVALASKVQKADGSGPLEIRVGVHTGPVAGGVLGVKRTLLTLCGDTLVRRITHLFSGLSLVTRTVGDVTCYGAHASSSVRL